MMMSSSRGHDDFLVHLDGKSARARLDFFFF